MFITRVLPSNRALLLGCAFGFMAGLRRDVGWWLEVNGWIARPDACSFASGLLRDFVAGCVDLGFWLRVPGRVN